MKTLLTKKNREKTIDKKLPVISDINTASSKNEHSGQPLEIRSEKVPIDQ
ncbi:hypothetical protein [Chryseobacterium gleum]|nr:hypothetical protein [Chryseobacterium gleum]